MSQTLLYHVSALTAVDIDSMDPTVSARYTKAGVKLHDMTSNQAMVCVEASRPERADIVKAAIDQIKSTKADLDLDAQVLETVDLLAALFCKQVFPYLAGRVHTQTSPSLAYDTEATANHARKLVALLEEHGIPRSRVCIKIPSTPEALLACKEVEKEGIRTLATSLFSVTQALAAHEAGCLYIAPWLNPAELRVHFEPELWTDYADVANEHPRMPIIRQIVRTYRDIGTKTEILPASIVTGKEVRNAPFSALEANVRLTGLHPQAVALAATAPEHLTLPAVVLDQLSAVTSAEPIPIDPKLASASGQSLSLVLCMECVSEEVKSVKYLDNDAAALKASIAADEQTRVYLADALKIFGDMEAKTREIVRAGLTA
ncbi:aldolase [Polyporus arcularius HHB13444]|uniref:Aldolase n=1 Tax=Polyporus arcularius HHB13444 TaxID=1314778 RepID=A0A5C3PHD2_9APHY|nr:aldolase [Polyporus arcularius HHB13444]